jgi:hypothetical protein
MHRAKYVLLVLAVVGLGLLSAASVSAGGPPIINETQHFADQPDVFTDVNPCDPSQEVEITSSDTGVIHLLVLPDGTAYVTGTIRSTVSIDVLPTDGVPDATGRVVTWFGQNGKIDENGDPFGRGVATFTSTVHVTFTDGTMISFHQVGHVLYDENGIVKIEFEKMTTHCG